ncbi:hypothetical protein [Natronobacterium gregoryi]|uniref:DUF5658 domain-containing protein n=2 Tax=Natronobacterium gregoryi TaxID=44930 RepID=L0ALA0_NATGS|nr:hypothetical protein [Natronobacterium gregoryi]AFZ74653.1 hypothetical protein Natgr_3535 [Natronobacterium gregoryi SP2]ELY72533.1 hypothetical protein C490_03053 [Natronobacterium gregoryi SP2]PLK19831.1 hypothetical protein CYV19_13060 [Natronobacterium gregoryi SP2]SFJ31396.1 hypothetical protein SAMN05443661_12170 [Natronobacterium gregoryi]
MLSNIEAKRIVYALTGAVIVMILLDRISKYMAISAHGSFANEGNPVMYEVLTLGGWPLFFGFAIAVVGVLVMASRVVVDYIEKGDRQVFYACLVGFSFVIGFYTMVLVNNLAGYYEGVLVTGYDPYSIGWVLGWLF